MDVGNNYGSTKTFLTSAAVAANRFVTLAAAGTVAQSAANAQAVGVSLAAGAAGERVAVQLDSIVNVQCGGAIPANARVIALANGEAGTHASNGVRLGTALETGADGQIIQVLYNTDAA